MLKMQNDAGNLYLVRSANAIGCVPKKELAGVD